MADKKIFLEVGRRTTVGNKVYGSGGQYEVDQDVAQVLVERGAKVLKGKLNRQTDTSLTADNQAFLTMIKRNAREIIGILEAASGTLEYEEESETEDTGEGSGDNASESVSGQSDSSSEDDEDEVTSTDDSDIPEDFPGHEILAKNNITKMNEIPTTKEALMELDQMTGRVANQIGVKLSEGK